MPRHPIADHSRELSHLQSKPSVVPRRNSKRVLIEPELSAAIARVESAIESRLREEINLRSILRIEKEREARIKEIVDLAVDESGRGLFKMINFEINRAAQVRPKIVVKRGDHQRAVEPVKKIIDLKRTRTARQQAKAERRESLHAILTRMFGCWLRDGQTELELRPIILGT